MGISATADRLPPGPRFAALQAARFVRGPVAFLESMRRRYGDVFTVPFPFFERLVYLADPESIKQVFKGDPRVFHAGEGNAGPLGPVVGDRSVFGRGVFGIDDEGALAGYRARGAKLGGVSTLVVLLPALRRALGRFSRWGRFLRVRNALDELLYGEIARGRADSDAASRDDVLS